jgi:dimethylargininase
MVIAFTRSVPASIGRCELTHLEREPIDYARAVAQHDAYEAALTALGCRVERLPEAPDLPDSVFVEDAAVVFEDLAVIMRPGAASRRPEVAAMAAALASHRPLGFIQPPGTMDGGDVLVTPGTVFVGISGRTNKEGAGQLRALLAPHGYEVVALPVTGCLHLKSAVTAVFLPPEGGSYRNGDRTPEGGGDGTGDRTPEGGSYRNGDGTPEGGSYRNEDRTPEGGRGTLLINPEWVDRGYFRGFELIETDPSEPAAANVLRLGGRVICAQEHPKTRERLSVRGLVTHPVPAGELAKAEGGVTCCSVIVRVTGQPLSSPVLGP